MHRPRRSNYLILLLEKKNTFSKINKRLVSVSRSYRILLISLSSARKADYLSIEKLLNSKTLNILNLPSLTQKYYILINHTFENLVSIFIFQRCWTKCISNLNKEIRTWFGSALAHIFKQAIVTQMMGLSVSSLKVCYIWFAKAMRTGILQVCWKVTSLDL